MDFSKIDEKDGDSELVFDGPELDDALADLLADTPKRAVPAPATSPSGQDEGLADLMDFIPAQAAPAPTKPRAPRKAPAIEDVDLSAMLGDITSAPAPAPPPEAAPVAEQPAVTETTDAAPTVPPPPATKADRLSRLALPLAALSAVLSSVGVVVTAHNLSTLAAQQAVLDKRAASLEAVPKLVKELEHVTGQARAELRLAAARRPADAATKADIDGGLDALRNALSRMQAPGTAALAGMVREGQSELAGEIDKLHDRMDAMDARRAAAAH